MKNAFLLGTLPVALSTALAQTPAVPAPDVQIKTAVLAAPADKRNGAAVYGYKPDMTFTLLRKGTNELVCLADDPRQKGLNVSCYHRDLEPFMERGRALKQAGKKPDEILKIREQEVADKKLLMPTHPSSLFSYTAKEESYSPATGEVTDGYLRYVVYIPYATPESTGLPLKPDAPGMPWLMDPGTHRAHIMINPPVSATAAH
ncbi:hypothetical protein GCM10027578_07560 [Spirosoma luteolum]